MYNRAVRSSPSPKANRQPFKLKQIKTTTTVSDKKASFETRYAAIVLGIIKANFADTTFTRDDVLTLIAQMRPDSTEAWATTGYGLNDVTTGTRYRRLCQAIAMLLHNKQLKSLDWLRLCLPSAFITLAAEVPPHLLYLSTIRRLVQTNFKPSTQLDAMMVVRVWKSDQHVPENVKRMAVRGAFPALIQAKILRRGDFKTLTVV